jgi:hypothetical protein
MRQFLGGDARPGVGDLKTASGPARRMLMMT